MLRQILGIDGEMLRREAIRYRLRFFCRGSDKDVSIAASDFFSGRVPLCLQLHFLRSRPLPAQLCVVTKIARASGIVLRLRDQVGGYQGGIALIAGDHNLGRAG